MNNKINNYNSSIKSRLISGGMWSLGGKFFLLLFGFIVNILLSRLLSPKDYGDYFLIFSLVQIFSLISQFGFNITIVKLISKSMVLGDYGRIKPIVKTLFLSSLIISLILSMFLIIFGEKMLSKILFDYLSRPNAIYFPCLWIILFTLQGLVVESFRGFHDIKLATFFDRLLPNIFLSIFLTALFFKNSQQNLTTILSCALSAIGINVIVSNFLLNKRLSLFTQSKPINYNLLLKESLPLLISSLTLFFLTQADIWIIGSFLQNEQVALYGCAKRLIVLSNMPLVIINAVVPPIITELYSKDEKTKLKNILQVTACMAFIPVVLFFLIYFIYGQFLLGLLFGNYYQSAGPVLIVLAFGSLFNAFAGSCGLTLMMTGYQREMMWITLFCGLLTIITEIQLIHSHGIIGIAIGSIIGLFCQNILMLVYVKKRIGIWTCANFNALFKTITLRNLSWINN